MFPVNLSVRHCIINNYKIIHTVQCTGTVQLNIYLQYQCLEFKIEIKTFCCYWSGDDVCSEGTSTHPSQSDRTGAQTGDYLPRSFSQIKQKLKQVTGSPRSFSQIEQELKQVTGSPRCFSQIL